MILAMRIVADISDKVGVTGIHLTPTSEGRLLYKRFQFEEHPGNYGEDNLFLPIAAIREFVAQAK